jgi:hypothetical protein
VGEAFMSAVRRRLGPRAGLLRIHEPRPAAWPRPAGSGHGAHLKVSIVTPVRNQARFIEAAMESVLTQEHPLIEYIVMDGASTDGTTQAIERHRARLAGYRSAPDGGQSDAINRGFEVASGDVLAWLNGDDLLLPGAVAAACAYLGDHPDIDVVYGDRILLDEDGLEIGRWILPSHSDPVLSWVDFIPQETLFWRRRAWERAGGYVDAAYQFAMDWEMLVRFRRTGARFAHIPRFMGGFRVHAAQKTTAQMVSVGQEEMDRIRAAALGHVPGKLAVAVAVAPYLARQMAAELAWRLRRGRRGHSEGANQ